MSTVTNISIYRFAELTGLKELREQLTADCKAWELKGTILLSTEGINMFVAGAPEFIEMLLAKLGKISGLEGLQPKISLSDQQPFNRMLVRIKKEIISFGMESIRPANYTSPKIAPDELKRWLDEGRPVTLLDTRNDYEVRLGTFKGALIPNIETFREFPVPTWCASSAAGSKPPAGWPIRPTPRPAARSWSSAPCSTRRTNRRYRPR